LREQLKLLEELQKHDARLQEIEGQLKTLPEKLDSLRRNLAKVEKMLQAEQDNLAQVEKWRREQEAQLRQEEEQIVKAKTKLAAVKTSKEYMASQREVENTRKAVAEREVEVLKLLEAIEQSKKSIEAHAVDVNALRAEVEQEEAVINGRIAELKSQADTLRAERDAYVAEIKPDVLRRYNHIRMRRGLAIVAVTDGVCQGCHMAIPPQLYNILQRRNSLELCPTCYRIIYWDRIMDEEPAEERVTADPAEAPPTPVEAAAPADAASPATDDSGTPEQSSEHKVA